MYLKYSKGLTFTMQYKGQSCFDKTLSGVVEMENLAWSEPELAGNKAVVHQAETLDLCLEGTWT